MPQRLKSLLYLGCFIIAAILYYTLSNTYAAESQNDKMIDAPLDEITISSFTEEKEEEEDEDEGKELLD